MQVRANDTHNADLLQGLHGAGSIFGVVMEVAFQLHDVSDYGGYVLALDDAQGSGFRCAALCIDVVGLSVPSVMRTDLLCSI